MDVANIDEVLSYAIAEETRAADTYACLAGEVDNPEVSELLRTLARQEERHREALERVQQGDLQIFAKAWPTRSQLLVFPEPVAIADDTSPLEVLKAAMDAERRAYLLYNTLAESVEDEGAKTLLGSLAREEAHHWSVLDEHFDELSGLARSGRAP